MLTGLRNFLIALFASLLIFGVGAYFIIGAVNNSFGGDPERNPGGRNGESGGAGNGGGEETNGYDVPVNLTEFTVLVLGIDDGLSQFDGRPEADTILLLNINASSQTLMVSMLPSDMRVEAGGYVMRLGSVYAEYFSEEENENRGAEMMLDAVWVQTGLRADYYCVLDYESLVKVFGILGDVEFNVPMDMYHNPLEHLTDARGNIAYEREEGAPEIKIINLRRGMQRINGDKALQLLRFRNYTDGTDGRTKTQLDFLRAVVNQKLNLETLANVSELYSAIKNSIETNLDERNFFDRYIEIIFSLPDYTIREITYPGRPEMQNGINFYIPVSDRARDFTYINFRRTPYIISGDQPR
jgi:LCP family protein required for cell wall assembly